MEKILYIIPGWQEKCGDEPYRLIADTARKKGFEVVCKDVDWGKPLSQQIFSVPKDAVVFGFSLGAVLGWLVAQKYPCRHLILASMTPHHSFVEPGIKKLLIDLAGAEFVDDLVGNLMPKHQAERQTTLYGEFERTEADIVVLHTEHELNSHYIAEISRIL